MSAQQIQVTPAASQRVFELLGEEGNFSLKLRVYVTGGGCSGFQYGFGFESEPATDDQLFDFPLDAIDGEKQSVQVIVDPISIMYLEGATIDYEVSLRGAQFKIINPNAQTTCGCGSSFSID